MKTNRIVKFAFHCTLSMLFLELDFEDPGPLSVLDDDEEDDEELELSASLLS